MAETLEGHTKGLFSTLRKDNWWVYPLVTVIVLGAFGAYSFWAAMEGSAGAEAFVYTEGVAGAAGHREYLSPFYSPCLAAECGEAAVFVLFGAFALSPAFLVMWAPLGLRATCYYYRKAYYRAFFWDPPACSVGEARHRYHGERTFPFVLQNLHRYFLYVALIFPIFLFYDAFRAFVYFQSDGTHQIAIGVGGLVMLLNAILLTGFTFGCHALRHWVGGNLNCYSCDGLAKGRHSLWRGVTWFNKHHGKWAWVSLVWVGLTDLYIRGLLYGWWQEPFYFLTGVNF